MTSTGHSGEYWRCKWCTTTPQIIYQHPKHKCTRINKKKTAQSNQPGAKKNCQNHKKTKQHENSKQKSSNENMKTRQEARHEARSCNYKSKINKHAERMKTCAQRGNNTRKILSIKHNNTTYQHSHNHHRSPSPIIK